MKVLVVDPDVTRAPALKMALAAGGAAALGHQDAALLSRQETLHPQWTGGAVDS